MCNSVSSYFVFDIIIEYDYSRCLYATPVLFLVTVHRFEVLRYFALFYHLNYLRTQLCHFSYHELYLPMVFSSFNRKEKPTLGQSLVSSPWTIISRCNDQRTTRPNFQFLHVPRIEQTRHDERSRILFKSHLKSPLNWHISFFYLFYHFYNIFITVHTFYTIKK